jgi:hypothetical protein
VVKQQGRRDGFGRAVPLPRILLRFFMLNQCILGQLFVSVQAVTYLLCRQAGMLQIHNHIYDGLNQ